MENILSDLEGVFNLIDDIFIYGENKEIHDYRLVQVLNRILEKGMTLNKKKCVFGSAEVVFAGFKVSGKGISPLESKV